MLGLGGIAAIIEPRAQLPYRFDRSSSLSLKPTLIGKINPLYCPYVRPIRPIAHSLQYAFAVLHNRPTATSDLRQLFNFVLFEGLG